MKFLRLRLRRSDTPLLGRIFPNWVIALLGSMARARRRPASHAETRLEVYRPTSRAPPGRRRRLGVTARPPPRRQRARIARRPRARSGPRWRGTLARAYA